MSDHATKRLHRIVGEINARLEVIAIGLATLDLVVLVALEMPAVPGKCLNCDYIAPPDGTVERPRRPLPSPNDTGAREKSRRR